MLYEAPLVVQCRSCKFDTLFRFGCVD